MPSIALVRDLAASYEPRLAPEAVSYNYDHALKEALETRDRSQFWRSFELFEQAERQLRELANLRVNWDSYGAEVPNERARRAAESLITLLRSMGMPPTRVVPSSEGGVGICFVDEDRYADIECFNSGEILAVSYRGTGEPNVWEVADEDDAIKAAIEQIRAHLVA
jgi:hypothetical protein